MTNDWVCYLIMSITNNATYIGSSNNQPRRLMQHNKADKGKTRRGAKRTQGQTWIPILIVSGFGDKRACLSFESGWKRLYANRNNGRLLALNLMSGLNLRYESDCRYNRILDLLYFVWMTTYIDTKFKLNRERKLPVNAPECLTIKVFMEDWIEELPWPYFVRVEKP